MQYTKHTFIKEIFLFVLCVHVILVMLLFVCDIRAIKKEKFVINTNDLSSTVVFLPLHKRVLQPANNSQSSSLDKNRRLVNYDAYQKACKEKNNKGVEKIEHKVEKKLVRVTSQKNKLQLKEQVVKVEKSVQKLNAATTFQREKNKSTVEAKVLQKTEVKKVLTEVEKKSVEKKKSVSKIAEKQLIKAQDKKIKPVEDLKIETVQAVEQSKKVEIEPVVEAGLYLAEVVERNEALGDTVTGDINFEDVSFIGRDDLNKYEIQEQIKIEIEKHWKAPIGISKKAVCELVISVGVDGKVLQVMIQKSSGSLAYDMSCRAGAYQSHFPKEVYGKEFIIELGS